MLGHYIRVPYFRKRPFRYFIGFRPYSRGGLRLGVYLEGQGT